MLFLICSRPPAPQRLYPAIPAPGAITGTPPVAGAGQPGLTVRSDPALRFVLSAWTEQGELKKPKPPIEVALRVDGGNYHADHIYSKLSIAVHQQLGRPDGDPVVPYVACHGNGAIIVACDGVNCKFTESFVLSVGLLELYCMKNSLLISARDFWYGSKRNGKIFYAVPKERPHADSASEHEDFVGPGKKQLCVSSVRTAVKAMREVASQLNATVEMAQKPWLDHGMLDTSSNYLLCVIMLSQSGLCRGPCHPGKSS